MVNITGVSGLSDQLTHIRQDLLQKVDISTLSSQNSINEQRIDSISSTIDNITSQLRALQQSLLNVLVEISDVKSDFTGHTGSTTGDGVHGH